jgi:hypothetical protein
MAAGQGFKTFATGDVLSAADVNGYLMQGVLVFADSAERDAEITSPEEGQFAYLKDTNVTTYYTGSTWANLDTTGMTNPMTTTGDTIYSSSGSTPARLGIGTAGQVLQVNSGATAPEWATPSAGGGGKVLQVVNVTNSTQADSTSSSAVTLITATITPSATSSKILVLANVAGCAFITSGTNDWGKADVQRNAGVATWNVADRIAQGMQTAGGSQPLGGFSCYTARLDEPASTSLVTYTLRFWRDNGSGTFRVNSNNAVSSVTLLEIGV